MTQITSKPMENGKVVGAGALSAGERKQSARPNIGVLRPAQIERAFTVLLYLAILVLVALSILGTFYGRSGESAPLQVPRQVWADIQAAPTLLGIAFGVQCALMLTQYGARQFAKKDRRWWLLYLVALGFSVYYNVQAYWMPLTAMIPWYAAAVLILAGDVLPEFIAVRRE